MPRAVDQLTAVESAWERSIPLPRIDRPFLDRHLGSWPELASRSWEVLSGGLRSVNLRSRDLVARISVEGPGTLAKEATVMRRVASEVRVPRVLDERAGVLLLEHVPHDPLPSTSEAGAVVGRAAARIHARRFPSPGMLDASLEVAESFPSAFRGLRAWAEERLASGAEARLGELAPRTRELWDTHAEELEAAGSPPGLVHSDFKPTNLKWLPEQKDVLVLDWEFAWSGATLLDVGMLLRWEPPRDFVRGFETGYREHGGHLPEHWERLAALLDLVNLVGFLDRSSPSPRRDRDVLRRIRDVVSWSAWLA